MNIAIVGSGIAGLSCAHALSRGGGAHQVSLFEAAATLGGHTNTVDVTLDGATYPVDTGFLVFNQRTYPNLIRLFADLEVPTTASEMSFSVSLAGELEWAGTSLGALFAQPRNALKPRFWAMLRDILRFNRAATAAADAQGGGAVAAFAAAGQAIAAQSALGQSTVSLGAWLEQGRYSSAFRDWYLLPMAGAIWSCPTQTMLDYPFATFARFCHNHGLLQVSNRPPWFTVKGGGREYVRRIAAGLRDVRVNAPVEAVRRLEGPVSVGGVPVGGVSVRSNGHTEYFDQVVLACHSDQAMTILADASAAERAVLGAIRYQPNIAYLHTDTALLPRRRAAWAAWNYLSTGPQTHSEHGLGERGQGSRPVAVSYLINKLQPLPFRTPVIVTLNPFTPPDPARVIAKFDYAHPVFDAGAIAAQGQLDAIQGKRSVWFAGAWAGYGFHEDGLKSGLAVAERLNHRDVARGIAAASAPAAAEPRRQAA